MNNVMMKPAVPDESRSEQNICLSNQEIEGSSVYCHWLKKSCSMFFDPLPGSIPIFLLLDGTVIFENSSSCFEVREKGVFIGSPGTRVDILCQEDAQILELQRSVTEEEWDFLKSSGRLPFFQNYEKAPRYREEGKSEKTINRMLVPQRMIPRFAMGSVETYGRDTVAKHSHPMLEQYFFSFRENDCFILIDDEQYPYPGNTLLHIPLGSDHGIVSEEGQTIHYVWMDFLFGDQGLKYMDEVHHMI
ncbi:MAG: hypothetical protein HFG54_08630 [Lachnospiraceae bacterium]|jgi:hypothetical protein|nr:hypothetical protein [Lachnospiraceae bacterium]